MTSPNDEKRAAREALVGSAPPGAYDDYYEMKDDERFGADIAAATRAIANSPQELRRIRNRVMAKFEGWTEIEVPVRTKADLVARAEAASMTVAEYIVALLVGEDCRRIMAEQQGEQDRD